MNVSLQARLKRSLPFHKCPLTLSLASNTLSRGKRAIHVNLEQWDHNKAQESSVNGERDMEARAVRGAERHGDWSPAGKRTDVMRDASLENSSSLCPPPLLGRRK